MLHTITVLQLNGLLIGLSYVRVPFENATETLSFSLTFCLRSSPLRKRQR